MNKIWVKVVPIPGATRKPKYSLEGAPRRYIEDKPVEIYPTSYYRRGLLFGEIEEVDAPSVAVLKTFGAGVPVVLTQNTHPEPGHPERPKETPAEAVVKKVKKKTAAKKTPANQQKENNS